MQRRHPIIWAALAAAAAAMLAATSDAAATAARAAAPQTATPQSRLYDVWLDLRLVGVFYPATNSRSISTNLYKVARQLHQPRTTVFFGEEARDALRLPAGVVVIDRHSPAETFILYTRSGVVVWMLVDDPAGHVKLSRIARP